MKRIRALIADDEQLAREYLRDLLSKCEDVEIVGEVSDGAQAVEALNKNITDIVFLDVQMPELNGMEVIQKIGAENMPVVVFVTAFDTYAIRAFEVSALDYLLKPFSKERFLSALDKARKEIQRSSSEKAGQKLLEATREYQSQLSDSASTDSTTDFHTQSQNDSAAESYITRLPVRDRKKVTLIQVDEIDWIESADDYVVVHANGKGHLLKESLQNLEQRLNPSTFARIHRGAIVNLDKVAELEALSSGDYQAILKDGSILKVSRRRRERLESLLGRPL